MLFCVFNKILNISFAGTIAVLVILIIKAVVRDKLGPRFQYVIWFILLLKLIPITNIYSEISLYNYVPSYETTMMNMELSNTIEEYLSNDEINNVKTQEDISILSNQLSFIIDITVIVIWIVGVVSILFTVAFISIRVNNKLKKSELINDKYIIDIFNECKNKINTQKDIKLITTDIVKTPCIYGVLKPKILIPKFMLTKTKNIDFKYIFLHELAHYKRCDLLMNYVIHIIASIHWFNPVIKYGLNKMKEDREIVCDSYVLSKLDESEAVKYGNSLLDLVEICSRAPWLPQMAGIINKKSKVKRRIIMIKRFKKSTYKLSALAMTVLVLVGGGLLTEAKANEIKIIDTNDTNVESQVIDGRIVDKIDLPFVNDDEVIGTWETVDFVKKDEDFNTQIKQWKDDLYLKKLVFLPEGKMTQPNSDDLTTVSWLTWTKGLMIHKGDKTASEYTIKEINGERYMFLQWKNGDYFLRGVKPYYYVLKEVK